MKARRAVAGWAVVAVVGLGACARGVQPPAQQVAGDAEAGRLAMEDYGCASCHVIPGVEGPNVPVGPPLEGFGQRRIIAGRLPNTPDNLAAWVENPQEIDPGNAMPDMGVSPEEARNIAAYLYGLR